MASLYVSDLTNVTQVRYRTSMAYGLVAMDSTSTIKRKTRFVPNPTVVQYGTDMIGLALQYCTTFPAELLVPY